MDKYKTEPVEFPELQYIAIATKKTQLCLHFSAGWDNARGMFDSWKADKARIATAFGMVDDGTIFQGFDEKYYASHIGYWFKDGTGKVVGGNERAYKLCPGTESQAVNLAIEQRTIGIEVCNWGALKFVNGQFHTWASKTLNPKFPQYFPKDIVVPESKVMKYTTPFRGDIYFEKFTPQEIESLYYWIKKMGTKHNIPTKYDAAIWDVNKDAITGVPGLYLHVSYRADKQDLHPQPDLIQMFKTL